MEKTCERCGKSLVCIGDVNCWCMTVFVPPKVSCYISDNYSDCICNDCINEIKAKFEISKTIK